MTCNPSSSIRVDALEMGIDVTFFKRGKPYGIDTQEQSVSWNGNSGASAINLAHHMGAKKVVLIGFDMKSTPEGKNFHKEYEDKGKKMKSEKALASLFNRHMRGFPTIKKDAEALGLKILNATPGSAIKDFPIIRLEDAL